MTGMRVLDRPPSMVSLYAKALRHRPRGGDGVPDHGLRLAGQVPDEARVAAYAALCGDRYGPHLPPLFPHLLGFGLQMVLLTDPAAPFPTLGLVHVANHAEVLRGIPLGTPLDVEVSMDPVRPHRKGRVVDLVARVSVEGEEVWRSRSTYLRRGKGSGESGADAAADAAVDAATGAAADLPERSGVPLTPSAVWRLPGDLGRRYGAVSGDRNPIHMSGLSARAFGFPRAIAHGMWTAARCLGALEGRLRTPYAYGVEFRAPIPLPGTVELLTAVGEKGTHLEVRAHGKDRIHLTGSTTPL
jgi:acyl dehydratase